MRSTGGKVVGGYTVENGYLCGAGVGGVIVIGGGGCNVVDGATVWDLVTLG